MPPISAVIITLNEESNIKRCISSVKGVADEIVVIDSESTDRTVEIAESMGASVFIHPFEGYHQQKNYGISKASHPYILSLDADEALSLQLEASILKVKDSLDYDGYTFNRLNHYCGTWIKHSNWYPDRKLRLFNREKGRWGGINPHDRFILKKGTRKKHLKGDLLHWVLDSYEDHIEKANRFSTIAAEEYFRLGRRTGIAGMIFRMCWRFFKAYILRGGFRDGYNGFAISSLSAYSSFLKYLKLRQKYLESKEGSSFNRNNNNIKIAGE